jgi:calcineurin-like phosphoesterase family protein
VAPVSRQAKVWVISDTHFGHGLMAQTRGFNGDVAAHDKALIDAWVATVRPQDTVWHLGDVYFREGYKALEYLTGNKKLVLGNHDASASHEAVLRQHFTLYGAAVVGENILTHIPVHPNQFIRFRLNIHGHTHAGAVCTGPSAAPQRDTRYVPVSVEHLPDFKPIQLIEACNT